MRKLGNLLIAFQKKKKKNKRKEKNERKVSGFYSQTRLLLALALLPISTKMINQSFRYSNKNVVAK